MKVLTTHGVLDSADLVIADVVQPTPEGSTTRTLATEWRLRGEGGVGGELVRRDVWVSVLVPQEMAATPNIG